MYEELAEKKERLRMDQRELVERPIEARDLRIERELLVGGDAGFMKCRERIGGVQHAGQELRLGPVRADGLTRHRLLQVELEGGVKAERSGHRQSPLRPLGHLPDLCYHPVALGAPATGLARP